MSDVAETSRHIKSISQTRQITNAMFLTSSSSMKKAVKIFNESRPFFDALSPIIKAIILSEHKKSPPAFREGEAKSSAYIVVTSDQGLVGSYNNDVLNFAARQMQNKNITSVFPIGEVGAEFFTARGYPVSRGFHEHLKKITPDNIRYIAQSIFEMMHFDQFEEIFIIYTRLDSTLKQSPECMKLLPLTEEDFRETPTVKEKLEFLHGDTVIVGHAVRLYLTDALYKALVQSYACEQCIRMNSMEKATRNADEMLEELKIELSRRRQEAITNELAEITACFSTEN